MFPPRLIAPVSASSKIDHHDRFGRARIRIARLTASVSAGRLVLTRQGCCDEAGSRQSCHGTARKEATPHRPIAPGTYGTPLPPSEPLISGAFFMRLTQIRNASDGFRSR